MALKRREFLKTAIGGAAAVTGFPTIIPSSALGADGAVAPSEKIVMACIGTGSQGGGHVRAFLQQEDVRMTAICDVRDGTRNRNRDLVNARYNDKGCATYNDYRELLARKDIDAVMIATPEHWHTLISIEAARQGKNIYCEKPIAVSIAEAKALREAVKRHGVVFQEGCQQRSDQGYRLTCELIRNGRIGQLETIMIGSAGASLARIPEEKPQPVPDGFDYDRWLGPAPWKPYTFQRVARTWMFIHDYGLGCPGGAWGIHDIDMAQWVSDNDHTTPIETEGEGIFFDDIRDTLHTWTVEHKYANGVKVIHMDISTAKKRAGQFNFGTMASVMFGSEGWIYVSRQGMRSKPESLLHEVIGPNEKKVILSNDHRRNFLNAIKTREQTIANVDSAAHGEMTNQQADIATRLKRTVLWDPVKEEFIGDEAATRLMERPMRSPWQLAVFLIASVLALGLGSPARAQSAMPLEEALAKVAAYEVGDDQAPFAALDRLTGSASSSPEKIKEMEQVLLKALAGNSTLAGKQQICRELKVVGSAASVPALAKLLGAAETAEMARYALERIPGPVVSQALRAELSKTSGNVKIGIVNTLGRRKDAGAVSALRALIPGSDPLLAAAAAGALGQIADPAAVSAIALARPKTQGALRADVDEAYLHAAEQMAQRGDNKAAFAIFKELSATSEPEITQIGALRGLALSGGKDAVPLLTAALKEDPKVQAQAIRQLSAIPGAEVTTALTRALAGMGPMGKIRTLAALADRGDKAALPVFLSAAKDNSQSVRAAALDGLGKIGDASVVLLLAETAAKGGTTLEQAAARDMSAVRTGGMPNERQLPPASGLLEEDAARASLYRMRGAEIDTAITSAIAGAEPGAEPKVKVELIAAAAARAISAATPALLMSAGDSNREVRRAAFRALRETARPADAPRLVDLLVKSPSADRADRAELGRVLSSALRRSDKASVSPVMSAYQSAADVDLRGTLLMVLGQVGRDESLPVLRSALKDNTAEVRRAAILALSDWPNPTPMPDLIEAARSDANPAYQILSLQGYLKLIGLPDTRTPAETIRLLAQAMSLAKRADEKRSILSSVQRFNTPEALALAEAAMKDVEVAGEAKAAADRIRQRLAPRQQ
jgi:predicted dehydrogenase/HEAT repeat protein